MFNTNTNADNVTDKIMNNNKQIMKLYTEEQLRKTWNEGFRQGMSIDDENYEPVFFEHYLKFLIPIELPNDEEIEREANIQYPVNLQPNGITLAGGKYDVDINYSERNVFTQCAKWMRDKIQGGNNEY